MWDLSSIYIFSRLYNGCKIPQTLIPWGTLLNGRKNVTLKVKLIVHCQTLVPWQQGSYQERFYDFTLVWNVQTTTHGFWIPQEMDLISNNHIYLVIYSSYLLLPTHKNPSHRKPFLPICIIDMFFISFNIRGVFPHLVATRVAANWLL